ncbi:hypothetical protein [Sinorhizobium meliloti]|uniref:hypothetical protein n=1 Tax=Rhizobium meliloti TaxID=382 RepID=UPI000FD90BAD|nr:hypothetical protein [Sinorhizobium meliloti]RVQ54223.1 hypothetical protein CN245_20070 [Sinorhizobium meliloti]
MTECKSLHDSDPPSDAIAPYHGQSFSGEGFSVLAIAPDGSGFRLHPIDTGMDAEPLSRREMIGALVQLYGILAFASN